MRHTRQVVFAPSHACPSLTPLSCPSLTPPPPQVLLPGHLLLKFVKEKMTDCLTMTKDLIMKDLEKNPEGVNMHVRV